MAATSDSLQRQVESLRECCPVLCPAITPNGYDTQDLIDLMQNAGRESVQAFEELLDNAGRGVSACCVCGADGTPSTSSSSSDDDDDSESTLFFTLLTGIDFKNRTVQLQNAGFACPQCRALRSTCRMIRFASLHVGGFGGQQDSSQGEAPQRLLVLAAHLASTNRAPEGVQASPEALAVWLQELYCRAYALQVVASNLGGWKAVGPEGQPLSLSRGKDVVAAARLLLGQREREQQKLKQQKQQKQKQQKQKQQQQAEQKPPQEKAQQKQEPGSTRKQGGKEEPKQKAAKAAAAPEQAPAAQEQRPAKKQKKSALAAAEDGQAAAAAAEGGKAAGAAQPSQTGKKKRPMQQEQQQQEPAPRSGKAADGKGEGAEDAGAKAREGPGGKAKGGVKAAAGSEKKGAAAGKGAGKAVKAAGDVGGAKADALAGGGRPGKKAKQAKQ
ncbi:hypothetical protein Agub_g11613 [Astrephomene gubernaculifera]|uniref:Uncharacterized protein n=1 Tax=Astrephomene gubernaculifera TaxID=47775 RepID=A0AAD3HQU4_9CHLO|nr:hypothetical protein Agub_g11613 [Astrephomene gubernaculifera]